MLAPEYPTVSVRLSLFELLPTSVELDGTSDETTENPRPGGNFTGSGNCAEVFPDVYFVRSEVTVDWNSLTSARMSDHLSERTVRYLPSRILSRTLSINSTENPGTVLILSRTSYRAPLNSYSSSIWSHKTPPSNRSISLIFSDSHLSRPTLRVC